MKLKNELMACFAVWAGVCGLGEVSTAIAGAEDKQFYEEYHKTAARLLALTPTTTGSASVSSARHISCNSRSAFGFRRIDGQDTMCKKKLRDTQQNVREEDRTLIEAGRQKAADLLGPGLPIADIVPSNPMVYRYSPGDVGPETGPLL